MWSETHFWDACEAIMQPQNVKMLCEINMFSTLSFHHSTSHNVLIVSRTSIATTRSRSNICIVQQKCEYVDIGDGMILKRASWQM